MNTRQSGLGSALGDVWLCYIYSGSSLPVIEEVASCALYWEVLFPPRVFLDAPKALISTHHNLRVTKSL